jgi:hemerythrin
MERKAVSQEVCDERHKALEIYLSNDKNKLAKHDGEIRDVQEAIVRLTILLEKHHNEIEDHEERIRSIETKPAKRWESMIVQIISLLAVAAAGGLIGHSI